MLAEIKMNNAGDSLWTIVQETDFQIVLRTCSKVREAGAGEQVFDFGEGIHVIMQISQ